LKAEGVSLHHVPTYRDSRGSLSARQVGQGVPFAPVRSFVVSDVPGEEVRGAHAHRRCHQLLTCLKGSMRCIVDDGRNREETILDHPEIGLYIPPMVWSEQYAYSRDAILLVLASHPYDTDDYIRDYGRFISERRTAPSES